MCERVAAETNAVLWRRQGAARDQRRPDVVRARPARGPAPDILDTPGLRRRLQPRAPALPAVAEAESPRRKPTAPPTPPLPLSDLDVHVAHGVSLAAAPPPAPASPRPPRLVRPARCGTLVSSTVDAWARAGPPDSPRAYRPLVFGGTYPIDEPATPAAPAAESDAARRLRLRRTIERSLDRFEAILARRGPAAPGTAPAEPRTFELDAPEELVRPYSPPREPHATYYVAGPSTFAVDEPVPPL